VPVALTSQDGPVEHRREVLPAHAAHGDGAELRVLMRQSILLLLFWVAINLQQETQRSFARANFDMLVEAVASWRMLRVTTSMAHSRSSTAIRRRDAMVLSPVGQQWLLVRLSFVRWVGMPTYKREAPEDRASNHKDRSNEHDALDEHELVSLAALSL
jgi:hypothetical protein